MTRHLLVVCTANVCRSPMGASLLRRSLAGAGLDIAVSSAGVRAGQHALPVDALAVEAMAQRGLDISGHQPTQVTQALVAGADMVLTMTRQDLREVVVASPEAFRRTFTWKQVIRRSAEASCEPGWESWLAALNQGRSARDLLAHEPADDIPDPYGRPLADHLACADELATLADQLTLVLGVHGAGL